MASITIVSLPSPLTCRTESHAEGVEPGDSVLRLGIAAQSPAGDGTDATFSEFGWEAVGLSDARYGS